MATGNRTAAKSAKKKATGVPFQPGDDPRRGRGPKPGAPNAGRPPSEIRAALRQSFSDRLPILAKFVDDPDLAPAERMKALELMAKYGMGTTTAVVDSEGQDVAPPVVILPAVGAP